MDYFSAFYSIYPRKAARLVAEKASKHIKEDEWPLVMEGLRKYIKAWAGKEKQFIPMPATFINQRRWEDEIECDEEIQAESASHTFMKLVQNKNNLTMPLMPHDIKQAVFRMGIPWGKLQQMDRMELEAKFESAYNYKPDEVISNIPVDRQKLAAGDNT